MTAEKKRVIERATEIRGVSVTDFVIDTAYTRAVETVREYEAWVVTEAQAAFVVDRILNPPDPLAVAKLGQRRGAGSDMLVNATLRAFLTHREVGAVGVTVRMKRENLFPFSNRMGFVRLPGAPLDIFVSMSALEKALEPALTPLVAPVVVEGEGA